MPPTDPLALIRRSIGLCQMMRNWPAPVLDTLAAAARLGRYARHEQILAEDPLRREVLVVASGGVAVDSVDASGARFLLSIHGPGEITALMRLLEDVGFVYDFHAREPTVLVHIPADALLGALDCQLANAVVQLARVHGRIAQGSATLHVRVSQSDLAAMLSVSRQTVNKELRRLEQRGLLHAEYGRLEILDLPGLEWLAQGRP